MKLFMPDLPEADRLRVLQTNADKIEETTYQKPLTEDELNMRREILTDNSIRLGDLEEAKKTATRVFKDQIDPLKAANKDLLLELRTKQAKVEGKLYMMANHEDGMMETYDEQGILIESRRLRPEEKQQNIFSLSKAL
jgi:hypothetical protein